MCLRRAPEKYIAGAKAPAGTALDRAALDPIVGLLPATRLPSRCAAANASTSPPPIHGRPCVTAETCHSIIRWFNASNYLEVFPTEGFVKYTLLLAQPVKRKGTIPSGRPVLGTSAIYLEFSD
jgi:hypothetical protein